MKLKTIFGSVALLLAFSPLANAQITHSDRGGPMVHRPVVRHAPPPRHRMFRCRNGSLRSSPAACRRFGGYRR